MEKRNAPFNNIGWVREYMISIFLLSNGNAYLCWWLTYKRTFSKARYNRRPTYGSWRSSAQASWQAINRYEICDSGRNLLATDFCSYHPLRTTSLWFRNFCFPKNTHGCVFGQRKNFAKSKVQIEMKKAKIALFTNLSTVIAHISCCKSTISFVLIATSRFKCTVGITWAYTTVKDQLRITRSIAVVMHN